jgi:hypothetical protein
MISTTKTNLFLQIPNVQTILISEKKVNLRTSLGQKRYDIFFIMLEIHKSVKFLSRFFVRSQDLKNVVTQPNTTQLHCSLK